VNLDPKALNDLPPEAWWLVAGALIFGWALAGGWRWWSQHRSQRSLYSAVTAAGTENLVDVLVPDGMGGFYHLDFVLLTPRGILVIDLRDVSGNIFGGDQMDEWTVMDGPRRFTFTNPQSGLYDRLAAVKAVAGDVPVEGRIVFTRRGKFPKGLPKFTLMVDSLRSEFPAVERDELASTVARFEEPWRRLCGAVTPSALNQVRPLSVN
jgi:hypothetical protein